MGHIDNIDFQFQNENRMLIFYFIFSIFNYFFNVSLFLFILFYSIYFNFQMLFFL